MEKKNLKVCVYAISKNEAKFVKRWCDSMKEADKIVVLDTGSSDDTVKLLKENGVFVTTKEIKPWRFDVARNESLKLVDEDTDICVCTDLDEVFIPGWRKKLEELWQNNDINRLAYNYNWSLDKDNKPLVNFYIEKIHKRDCYIWKNPVHEILINTTEEEKKIYTDEITLNHYPDPLKSRGSYLPLLELSVKEDPENDRNMHYLGREYMYYGKWQEAIDTLKKHLTLKSATWNLERAASMRFIARCYTNLEQYDEARLWLDKAILEASDTRDGYIERALLEYRLGNDLDVIKYCNEALKITTNHKCYINETFSWNETVYDLLAISYYNLGKKEEALENINKALAIKPDDERLQNNKKFILNL